MSDIDPTVSPAPRADLGQGAQAAASGPIPAAAASAPATSGFDFNHPTIISLLYLSSMVLGVTALVGVILGYVWKGEAHADWETSHYDYLIRTFWIALVGSIVSFVLMLVVIGFLLIFAVWILVVVRCVLSLVNAQKRQPMPNPQSLFV
jgi:uncharacterized membrane protein